MTSKSLPSSGKVYFAIIDSSGNDLGAIEYWPGRPLGQQFLAEVQSLDGIRELRGPNENGSWPSIQDASTAVLEFAEVGGQVLAQDRKKAQWATLTALAEKLLPEVSIVDSMMFGHAFTCEGRIHAFFNDRTPTEIGQPLRGTMEMSLTLETIACLLKAIQVGEKIQARRVPR